MQLSYKKLRIKKRNIEIYGTMVLLLLYSFFYQVFFTSGILKYTIFSVAFVLIAKKRIKSKIINSHFVTWTLLILYMLATSVTPDDRPITLMSVLVITYMLMGNHQWIDQFLNVVIVFAMLHALITIACWVFPVLRTNIIIPLFFEKYTSRDIIGYQCGFTNNYSTNGMYLGFGVVASGINYLNNRYLGRNHKIKDIVILFIILLALILTTKRTHLVAALASIIFVYIIFSEVQGRILSAGFKAILSVGIMLSIIVTLSTTVPFLGELMSRFIELRDDTTFHGRSYFYVVAIKLWQQNPIFGEGWGGFTETFRLTKLGRQYAASGYAKIQPHNVYIQLLSDLGIIGFALFIFASLRCVFISIRKIKILYKEDKNNSLLVSLQFALGVQFYYLICGFTGNPLNDAQMYIPYLISCAAVYAIVFKHKQLSD